MSLSDFGKENYDASAWVNEALAAKPEDDAFEGYLAGLAMRLHMASQDYTDQLESAMLDATQTIPRVQNDITRIEDVLKSVNSEMQELANQLKLFDQRNVAGVEELSRLDMLRRNMEIVSSTLEEHARWSQVVREAKTFLEGGGRLADSADRVSTMVHSLKLLEQMPGHEGREQTCQVLSDSLLSAVKPRVTTAIAADTVDVPGLLEYFYVYQKLDRLPELQNEYIAARSKQKSITDAWELFDPVEEDLSSFYASFMERLATFAVKESASLSVLFMEQNYDLKESISSSSSSPSPTDDSSKSLSVSGRSSDAELLCDVVKGICEATAQRTLSTYLEESASPADMVTVYQATNALVLFILAHIYKLGGAAGGEGRPARPSSEEGVNRAALTLLKAAYDPLAANLDAVYAADARVLRAALSDILDGVSLLEDPTTGAGAGAGAGAGGGAAFEDATGLGLTAEDVDGSGTGAGAGAGVEGSADPVRQCIAYSERLLGASGACTEPVNASVERAGLVLSGLHYKARIKAISGAVGSHLKRLTGKIEGLRTACGLGSASVPATATGAPSSPSTTDLANSWARQLGETDALITGATRELLPAAMRALQCTGRVLRSVHMMDKCSVASCQRLAASFPILTRSEDLPGKLAAVVGRAVGQTGAGAGGGASPSLSFQPFLLISRTPGTANTNEGEDSSSSSSNSSSSNSSNSSNSSSSGSGGVDIGALYAADACLNSSTLGDARHALRTGDYHAYLLSSSPAVTTALGHLKAVSGCLFVDCCTALPMRLLHLYSSEAAWASASSTTGTTTTTSSGEEDGWDLIIDDNLLPISSLTQCGEHLLSLVQDLESFGTSDAISDLRALAGTAENILPYSVAWGALLARSLTQESIKQGAPSSSSSIGIGRGGGKNDKGGSGSGSGSGSNKAGASAAEVEEGVRQLSNRAACVACVSVCEKVVFGSSLTDLSAYTEEQEQLVPAEDAGVGAGAGAGAGVGGEDVKPPNDASSHDTAALDFVNQWLGALGDTLVGVMVSHIVNIRTLSSAGRAQLAVDLDYLTNVISAVGLQVHPLLLHIRSLLSSPLQPQALLAALRAMPAMKPVAISLRLLGMALARAMDAGRAL